MNPIVLIFACIEFRPMFRRFLKTIIFLLLASSSFAFGIKGNIEDLFAKANEARKAYKDMEAVAYYKQILQLDSNNFEALWNVSFLYQKAGWLETLEAKKKQLLAEAMEFARKTYAKYPNTYHANIVMAGAIARMTEFRTAKERVTAAWDIKKFGDAAFGFNSKDHQVWYLLGWWNFELSKPTWFERSMAGMLFGGLPGGATVDKGIEYMKKACELMPGNIVYLYDLATFYEHKGDFTAAKSLVEKALIIQPLAPEDFIYIEKLKGLLSRLKT